MKLLTGKRVGYLYILPAFLFMTVLIFFPIIYNLILSFQDVNVMTLMSQKKESAGIENYIRIFKSPQLYNSLKVTILYTFFSILFQFSIGLILAVLFNRETLGFKGMKSFMLVPYIIPPTVTAIVFKFLFSVKGGIFNEFLMGFNLISERVEWLLSPNMALASVTIANIWSGIPFFMILLSTGIANIPDELYESADIDGASVVQKFFYITIPSIKSSITASLVLGIVYTFRCFELIYVMTAGGPVGGTELMTIYSYKTAFVKFNFSLGAVIANIHFIILFVIGLLYARMINREHGEM